jgi:hypothetical protein
MDLPRPPESLHTISLGSEFLTGNELTIRSNVVQSALQCNGSFFGNKRVEVSLVEFSWGRKSTWEKGDKGRERAHKGRVDMHDEDESNE